MQVKRNNITLGKVFNRVILNRLKEQVKLASTRTDQIATLCIIIEQSMEWSSPLYINFIDHEKAFDSVNRESL